MQYTQKIKYLAIFTFVLLIPVRVFAATSDLPEDDICSVTMHGSALELFPIERMIGVAKAGSTIDLHIEIQNRTAVAFRDTQILMKVSKVDISAKNWIESTPSDQLVDIQILPQKYDLAGNTKQQLTLQWNSPTTTPSGLYRFDFFPVQNGVHVLGDYPRNLRSPGPILMNINGSVISFPLHFVTLKTKVAKNYCGDLDMCVLEENEQSPAVLTIHNDAKNATSTIVEWKVYEYGKLSPDALLLATSSRVTVSGYGDATVSFPFPNSPFARYYGEAEMNDYGQRNMMTLRVARNIVVSPSVDTYGIAENNSPIGQTVGALRFPLKKGTTYNAFACLVGGIMPATTTVSMEVQDANGNVIFQNDEDRYLEPIITSFHQDFVASRDIDNAKLIITTKVNGQEEVTKWQSNDQKSKLTLADQQAKDGSASNSLLLGSILFLIVIAFALRYEFVRHTKHHE